MYQVYNQILRFFFLQSMLMWFYHTRQSLIFARPLFLVSADGQSLPFAVTAAIDTLKMLMGLMGLGSTGVDIAWADVNAMLRWAMMHAVDNLANFPVVRALSNSLQTD